MSSIVAGLAEAREAAEGDEAVDEEQEAVALLLLRDFAVGFCSYYFPTMHTINFLFVVRMAHRIIILLNLHFFMFTKWAETGSGDLLNYYDWLWGHGATSNCSLGDNVGVLPDTSQCLRFIHIVYHIISVIILILI